MKTDYCIKKSVQSTNFDIDFDFDIKNLGGSHDDETHDFESEIYSSEDDI